MKVPGPDHPITIAPTQGRVRVLFAGEVIADSHRALTLTEASYPPVQYIPRDDVVMHLLGRTAHMTRCPYKGEANYFTIEAAGREAKDAAWSYEAPFPAMAQIAHHIAFYPSRVDQIEVLPE